MSVLKGITVIGALAVGVLIVSKVVTGSSKKEKQWSGAGGVPMYGGIGSAVGGAKADAPVYNYNFPEFSFPSMPVLEMPEALANQVKDETVSKPTQPTETKKQSKALTDSTFVWGGDVFKKDTYVSKEPTQYTGGMTKKQALYKKLDEQDDASFFGQYGGFFK